MDDDPRDDGALLAATRGESAAFGVFYRRHLAGVVAYFLDRTGDAEVAADLTAETFAAALVGSARYRRRGEPAAAWLYGIARHKLADSWRRGRVEERSRRRLGMTRLALTDDDLERVEVLADLGRQQTSVLTLVDELPVASREAVRAHVLEDRPYRELAQRLGCSEQVVRKRVSRGLAQLRTRLDEQP